MAGTIPLSMTQQLDIYGQPLAGGQLFIIQAGTVSTPQDAFQDTNLTIRLPYPISLDAAGRVPQFFVADGTIKIRLQDRNGVVQLAADSVLVIGPSAGGGGSGVTVDPNALNQTGNLILRYGVGVFAGHVRLNGLSIGNAISGATERQNSDTQNLFQYLYGIDSSLVLRDSSQNIVARTNAANDFTTLNRNLALPDWRGYALGALDDMGNAAAGRLGSFFANATLLGSAGGLPYNQLSTTNLPAYTPVGSITLSLGGITISGTAMNIAGLNNNSGGGGGSFAAGSAAASLSASQGASSASFTGSAQGGSSQPFGIISPRKLCTFYIKL